MKTNNYQEIISWLSARPSGGGFQTVVCYPCNETLYIATAGNEYYAHKLEWDISHDDC